MELKAGLGNIADCSLGGSLTGALGLENPSSFSIVFEFSADPFCSHGNRRLFID